MTQPIGQLRRTTGVNQVPDALDGQSLDDHFSKEIARIGTMLGFTERDEGLKKGPFSVPRRDGDHKRLAVLCKCDSP